MRCTVGLALVVGTVCHHTFGFEAYKRIVAFSLSPSNFEEMDFVEENSRVTGYEMCGVRGSVGEGK